MNHSIVAIQTPEQAKNSVFQLKVTLKGIRPPIWRRFQVPADINLHGLHLILQTVMGWGNCHLYKFGIAGEEYAEPDLDNAFYEQDFTNSRRTKLWKVLRVTGSKSVYTYDFGDCWQHELLLEKSLLAEPDRSYPICLAGKRHCPPEDCGGPWGYQDLLAMIRDQSHEEYENKMMWLDGQFDSETFDPEDANRALSHR